MTVSESSFAGLIPDLETDWQPDPWGWSDLRGDSPPWVGLVERAASEPVDLIHVPLVGNRSRTVALLRAASKLVLHRAAAEAAWRARHDLAPGVAGYRWWGGSIPHYRAEYRRRTAMEAVLAARHRYVVQADVRSFFPSVSAASVRESVGRYLTADRLSGLSTVLSAVTDVIGHPLAEGYSGSRALANLTLMDVDAAISHPFTRWIDDYRIFVDTSREAERALGQLLAAMESVGLAFAESKVKVTHSKHLRCDSTLSMGDDHPEVTNPASKLHSMLANHWTPDPLTFERLVRHYLRLCAERRDPDAYTVLRDLPPEALPPTALPRLAWFLASTPADEAEAVISAHLSLEDDFSHWRTIRLAPSLWFARTLGDDIAEKLVKLADAGGFTGWLAVARPIAHKAPAWLDDLDAGASAEREQRLIEMESRRDLTHSLGAPPIAALL